MTIIICDDTPSDRKRLIYCLNKLAEEYAVSFEIKEYPSAAMMLNNYEDCSCADVIFLDIYMSELDGLEAASRLRANGYNGSIIFTTSSTDHAVASYQVKADGYLVKPYNYTTFRQSVWRLEEKLTPHGKEISFIADRLDITISLTDVLFFESSNKGTLVHTGEHTYFTWKKISEFEEETAQEESFYKITRSFIINMSQIREVNDLQIIMKDSSVIDIPVRDKLQIRQHITDYLS